jgi:hypothetical protein
MTTKNRNHVRAAKAGLRKAKRRKELQQRRAQQPKPDLLQYFNTTVWDEAQKMRERHRVIILGASDRLECEAVFSLSSWSRRVAPG